MYFYFRKKTRKNVDKYEKARKRRKRKKTSEETEGLGPYILLEKISWNEYFADIVILTTYFLKNNDRF